MNNYTTTIYLNPEDWAHKGWASNTRWVLNTNTNTLWVNKAFTIGHFGFTSIQNSDHTRSTIPLYIKTR